MHRLNGYERKKLAAQIKADIDAFCKWKYTDERREHLGASVIGQVCLRRLVYTFRWMHLEQFDGRMLRLFNRGHLEEKWFIAWLRGIGARVSDVTADGKQHRIGKHHGHFNGSLDSIIQLPDRYQLRFPFLGEFKTHNDKSFKKLQSVGVKIAKPEHFAQMCVYGECYEYGYALYLALNKNDDDIYVEVVELDWTYGKKLRVEKAGAAIMTDRLPSKIAATAAYTECKYCPMSGICHNGEAVDVNCRSCTNSQPMQDGSWFCRLWNATIPAEAIPAACGQWQAFT